MGWDFGYGQTKKALIEHLTKKNSEWEYEGKKFTSNCVAHSVVGNHLWGVFDQRVDDEPVSRYICLFLLANDRSMGERSGSKDNWGYKDITESMGPYETDCPLYLLEMTPLPKSEYAKGWREKVQAYHASKKTWSSLKDGDTVKLASWLRERYSQETVTIQTIVRNGRTVKTGVLGGSRYRIGKNCLDLA